MVIEDKGLAEADKKHSIWKNLVSMIKRYISNDIPDTELEFEFGDARLSSVSDEDGFYNIILEPGDKDFQEIRKTQRFDIRIGESMVPGHPRSQTKGELITITSDAQYAVVSDVDDTMLISHATQMLRKVRLMLLKNARTRKPFLGSSAFYRALNHGNAAEPINPIFYVSNSEWNLYDLLDDFCAFNEFPKGVFMLKEVINNPINLFKSGSAKTLHKYEALDFLFNTITNLPFILIGDSGQHDPELYLNFAKKYPERIHAVYIRSIKNGFKNPDIIKEFKELGVDLLLVENTFEAAKHAYKKGYIPERELKNVFDDMNMDSSRISEDFRDLLSLEE
jgi:phosphatidate phosphatase APP1